MIPQALSNKELSVVVLCYRAEDDIIAFLKQLDNELTIQGVDFELVLVANYEKDEIDNKDKTPEIVKRVAEQNTRYVVVSKEKQGKMGWDMRSGMAAATGRYIAVIDGDGQMPSSDIGLVYKIIKEGNYDLVKTYRVKRFDGMYRSIISFVYNMLFKILFRPEFVVNDINSKPKVMTREAYEKMKLISNDWFTDAEIMIEAFKNKLKICEVAAVFYKNERRKSYVGVKTIFEFIYNLLYYRFRRY